MAYTDFIAAIDLGTSHIIGMVGVKNAAGALSVIAYEDESSEACVRRGCVYNVDKTAMKIRRLIGKLENKLGGSKIGKVYVGLNGLSLRSIDHNVSKSLGADGVVTKEVLDSLRQECDKYRSDAMMDVLSAVSPVYYLDNKQVANPLGLSGGRIEARYKLIVGRPSLKGNIKQSFERANVGIAGFVISALSLGDILLSERDKEQGCALIEFGAGVTTLTVYERGSLANLSVVPFGGDLITRDIESLGVSAQEAERLKTTYGCEDKQKEVQVVSKTNDGTKITLKELYNVVEAREREIVENVNACLKRVNAGPLDAGVIITGGAANLKGLWDMVHSVFKMKVREPFLRINWIANDEPGVSDSLYFVALSILSRGTVNCAILPKEPEPAHKPDPVIPEPEPVLEPEVVPELEPEQKSQKNKGKNGKGGFGGLFGGWGKKMDSFSKTLFDDEYGERK